MKKVLYAGVVLLFSASFLAAQPQAEPTPQEVNNAAVKATKPKSSKKSNTKSKTSKATPSAPASEEVAAPAQSDPQANATGAKDAASYYEIGLGHYESKRFKDAIDAFKQSIRLGSTEPKTYFNLGQAYYSLGLYKEAREAYKRAVRVKPDWAEAHFQLGWVYHILNDDDSSQAQYKLLQTLNPEMAASFQKLLDSNPNEPSGKATSGRENAKANVADASTTAKNQEAALPVVASSPTATAPDNATPESVNQQSSTSETTPGLTGSDATNNNGTNSNSSNPNGANSNSANSNSVAADATNASATSPVTTGKDETAKDATAASEPVASSSELPLTSVYRVGVGDVLDIRLLNTPTSRSTLFTVMSGGLIEYPLAGGSFTVAGLTTDEIGARLTAELKRRGIGDSSPVVVGVRDYTSHTVIVSGLVNYPGRKILSREAVPLYVIVAEAQLRADASRAVIMRANESIPINDINDPASLNVAVKPGDVITISARQLQYYFIGGRINSPGQKLYQPGLTLIQAILAAGGLSRSQDTVEISREEADGRLTTTKYVLKEIKSGKIPDPRLQPGDRIEVGH